MTEICVAAVDLTTADSNRMIKERRSPGRRLKVIPPAGKLLQIQRQWRLQSRQIFLTGDAPWVVSQFDSAVDSQLPPVRLGPIIFFK